MDLKKNTNNQTQRVHPCVNHRHRDCKLDSSESLPNLGRVSLPSVASASPATHAWLHCPQKFSGDHARSITFYFVKREKPSQDNLKRMILDWAYSAGADWQPGWGQPPSLGVLGAPVPWVAVSSGRESAV